ncbi:MAG: trypsin-like peptidase domain-containing protein [Oscillospiraceae bacterium]|nr:trypsin-like peptidase domain-containing protein [Oscillospiraceae bacterium]
MDTYENPGMPEPVEQPTPKKTNKVLKTLVAALLIIALVAGGCCATALLVNEYWEEKLEESNELTLYAFQSLNNQIKDLEQQIKDNSFTGNGNSVSGTPNAGQDGGLTPGQVYAQNVKAVVAISNQATTNIYGQITETASSGSGFIISEDGYVVTNYHVAEGATKLTVILHDSTEYVAKLVGYDAGNDVALLKVEATGLPYVKLGSSKDLIVGDQVVAIGNPLGQLTNSLTVGYVSALERGINTGGAKINMIQTDAAINSGNSGGPLFNMKGEAVGITTAKYSGTSNSGATIEGISFAIPFDDVLKKITDLMEYGYLRGAYLGITVSDDESGQGAKVREVSAGYCAEKAGMQAGDVIQSLGGYPVTCMNDLGRALEHFSAGDTIQVQVLRNGKQVVLELTLDERPKMTNTDASEPTDPSAPQEESANPVPQNGTMEDWWNYFFGNEN